MNTKKVLGILIIFLLMMILVACSKSRIAINGQVNTIIEVGSGYEDEGVTLTDDYVLITTGTVNTNKLGIYEIKYSVLNKTGELVKELFRFVEVVDTQKPTYSEKDISQYYVGFKYTVDDFLEYYSDNYDDKKDLVISPNSLIYQEDGTYKVEITITDRSGNSVVFKKSIDLILDFEKLLDEVYKNESYKVNKGTTGIGSSYIRISLNSMASFSYYDSGSLHYIKRFTTNLGSNASIQISATYGNFEEARLNYHINGSGSTYSVGFITFDATKKYESLTFNSFNSVINNLDLNQNDMLNEMNPRVLGVLNEFKSYVEETLNIKFY